MSAGLSEWKWTYESHLPSVHFVSVFISRTVCILKVEILIYDQISIKLCQPVRHLLLYPVQVSSLKLLGLSITCNFLNLRIFLTLGRHQKCILKYLTFVLWIGFSIMKENHCLLVHFKNNLIAWSFILLCVNAAFLLLASGNRC